MLETTQGAPDIIIPNKNAPDELLHAVGDSMTNCVWLAQPRQRWDGWHEADYHRIAELPTPVPELDALEKATSVIKLMAEAPELQLLERASGPDHIYTFAKISEERKKNAEIHPTESRIPFSPFELALYKRLSSGIDFWYWEYEKKITQNLTDAMNANPAVAWQAMQQFGLDMLIPALSHLSRSERAKIARTIKQEMSRPNNTKTGSDIFCEALAKTSINKNENTNDFRKIMQLLPQLYAYYDESKTKDEPQSDKYYQHIAIALAYYSAIRGSGPFGSVLRIGSMFIGATNEWNNGKKDFDHAEEVVIIKGITEFGDPQLKGFVLYTPAEPCFDCTLPIRDNYRALEAVHFGVPTSMGSESVHGLLSAEHLTDLRCGPPPKIVPGLLENESRRLYNDFMGWNVLVPPKQLIFQ